MIEQSFDTGAASLNYVADGREDGRPMVFLHGVTDRWRTWLPTMTAFAADWRVYALDFRGHAQSSWVPGAYRAVDYATDVVAFLRGRVGEPAVLVGHSLGGIVALAVADEAPEAIRAAVLEDPPFHAFDDHEAGGRPDLRHFRAFRDLAAARLPRERLYAALAELQPDVDAATLGNRTLTLGQMDPGVLTAILEDTARHGYELSTRLGRVACPVLLQQGNAERGAALDDVQAARARALLARCTFEHFADAGHGIHSQQPFDFCRSVRRFLRSLP